MPLRIWESHHETFLQGLQDLFPCQFFQIICLCYDPAAFCIRMEMVSLMQDFLEEHAFFIRITHGSFRVNHHIKDAGSPPP